MRNYGSPQPFDLTSDGGTSVALTPGAAVVNAEFLVTAPKSAVGDNFPLAMAIVGRLRFTFDQAASGGTAVNWDDLARVIDSIDVQSPVLGNTHPKDSFPGPVLKHVVEFTSQGYTYADGARAQIAAADGDTTVDHYFVIPYANELLRKPHHCAPWIGWLVNTKVKLYLAASTVFDSLSTGAVTKATTNVQMWVETVIASRPHLPTLAQFHLYESPAAGGTTATLIGIGMANGLSDVKEGSRLAQLFELTDVKGMGAADGADNITSVTIPQLGLDTVTNVDAFFAAYRRAMGGHRGPVSGVATTIVADRAGNPEGMSATPNGVMNTATAMYTPYRFMGRDAELTKIPKFVGDLKIVRSFTSNPASGRHRFVTLEFRELGEQKKGELKERAGRSRNAPTSKIMLTPGKLNGRGDLGGLPEEF